MLMVARRSFVLLPGGVMEHRRGANRRPVMSGALMHACPVRKLHQQQRDGEQRAEGA
jgi:hypothetical protein